MENINILKNKAEKVAAILKSISNENRLLTLCFLMEGEKTVGEITNFLNISQPAVSQMLAKMKDENIVSSIQVSQKVLYSIKDKNIMKIFNTLTLICDDL